MTTISNIAEKLANDPRLLPCPFCGEERIFLNVPDKSLGFKGSINCPACLVEMPNECGEAELIECWNARAAINALSEPNNQQTGV